MADYGGSTTNPIYRDRTRTPQWLFDALDLEYGFSLDAAALPETALCANYLTPAIDALSVSWGDYIPPGIRAPWAWLNPPYSDIMPWVRKAMDERERGIGCVMLVPLDPTAEWYPDQSANEIRQIVGFYDESGRWRSGRINFISAETGEEIRGNPKGSMLLIFAPNAKPPANGAIVTHISKGELLWRGRAKATIHNKQDLIDANF